MNGLYSLDGTFKSAEDIRREAVLTEPHNPPIFHTEPLSIGRDFTYWSERLKNRQQTYAETTHPPKCVDIEFQSPPLINFQADLHIGGAYTDYSRIEAEAEAIVNTPNSFVFLMGDLIDAFFFNPAQYEDIEQTPEQIEYAKSLIRYYYDNGKLLGVWNGNHDAWVKKHGIDPYVYMLEGIETHYFHGVGYVRAKTGDEVYNITGNHMFKGSSLYANTHPQRRALNESARGSDIVVSGHWHQKGITQQPIQEFGGDSKVAVMLALGTYKATDEYIRTYGFANRDPKSMYGSAVTLAEDGHNVQPYFDILEAHREYIKR